LYKELGSKGGLSTALAAIVAADYDNDLDAAKGAAEERIQLLKELGEVQEEANAQLALANVHVAAMGRKIARCSVASLDDTLGALEAAKAGNHLYARIGSHEGIMSTTRAVASVLMYNKVPPEAIDAAGSPDDVIRDVLSGRYSHAENALPRQKLATDTKLEDTVPSSKVLERQRFGWTNPVKGLSYTMIWQPCQDRQTTRLKPKGSFDVKALRTGNRTTVMPALMQVRSHDQAEKGDPMVVYMLSSDARQSYATTLMNTVQTIAAMITAKLKHITVVQFDETHFDWTDTKTNQVAIHPAILGLIRSCRLEAPNVLIGYVGGDAPSWLADPVPMINRIFEVVENDETEIIYKRGDAYAPLMVHREMDETVQYVKPTDSKQNWMPGMARAGVMKQGSSGSGQLPA